MKEFIINTILKLKNNLLNLDLGKPIDWWPLLLGPGVFAVVYISFHLNPTASCWVVNKSRLEIIALFLTSAATLAYLIRAILSKKFIFIFFTVLAAAFLCREIHFAGTSVGIYIVLVALALWGIYKQDEIFENLNKGQFLQWLVSTVFVYFLGVLMARRALKFLPLEHDLHVAFEEMLENGAHLMLFITAFSDLFTSKNNLFHKTIKD